MNEESLQARINALPREHDPKPYAVTITDKRGNFVATRYVRASSKKRAELAGAKANIYIFGNKKTFGATARQDGW
jgi:hypothetical protein